MRALGLVVLVLVGTTACSSTASIVKELSKSKRSWCLYSAGGMGIGETRVSGTGIEAEEEGFASAECDSKGHRINMGGNTGTGGPPPGAIVIPAQPRVYIQEAPGVQEIDPNALRRVPPRGGTPPPAR